MKKLFGILVVVALMAVPAMAVTVDVTLTVESYILLYTVPDSVVLNVPPPVSPEDEHRWGDVAISGVIHTNMTPSIASSVADQYDGAHGLWRTDPATILATPGIPGAYDYGVMVVLSSVPYGATTPTGVAAIVTITLSGN